MYTKGETSLERVYLSMRKLRRASYLCRTTKKPQGARVAFHTARKMASIVSFEEREAQTELSSKGLTQMHNSEEKDDEEVEVTCWTRRYLGGSVLA